MESDDDGGGSDDWNFFGEIDGGGEDAASGGTEQAKGTAGTARENQKQGEAEECPAHEPEQAPEAAEDLEEVSAAAELEAMDAPTSAAAGGAPAADSNIDVISDAEEEGQECELEADAEAEQDEAALNLEAGGKRGAEFACSFDDLPDDPATSDAASTASPAGGQKSLGGKPAIARTKAGPPARPQMQAPHAALGHARAAPPQGLAAAQPVHPRPYQQPGGKTAKGAGAKGKAAGKESVQSASLPGIAVAKGAKGGGTLASAHTTSGKGSVKGAKGGGTLAGAHAASGKGGGKGKAAAEAARPRMQPPPVLPPLRAGKVSGKGGTESAASEEFSSGAAAGKGAGKGKKPRMQLVKHEGDGEAKVGTVGSAESSGQSKSTKRELLRKAKQMAEKKLAHLAHHKDFESKSKALTKQLFAKLTARPASSACAAEQYVGRVAGVPSLGQRRQNEAQKALVSGSGQWQQKEAQRAASMTWNAKKGLSKSKSSNTLKRNQAGADWNGDQREEPPPKKQCPEQGQTFNLDTIVINMANVMCKYGKDVYKREKNSFDWEGARRCITYFKTEEKWKVVAVIDENYTAPDRNGWSKVKMPDDIRRMLGPGNCIEVPRLDGENHASADDEATIVAACNRKCRWLDNDNYREWKQQLKNARARKFLNDYHELLHVGYFFDVVAPGDGVFSPVMGNQRDVDLANKTYRTKRELKDIQTFAD